MDLYQQTLEGQSPITSSDPQNQFPPTFNFEDERKPIDTIISDWKTKEEPKVKERREIRENRKNVGEEVIKGTILADETIIADHTINTNIHRGRVPYVNYISQSKRLLILEDLDNPNAFVEPTENWFTKGMRYPKWKVPWFKLVDAVHTHGGAAMEVVSDPEAPFNCSIEYIARGDLMFNEKTRDLQAVPRLIRRYEVSILKLDEMAKTFSFDEVACKAISDKYRAKNDLIDIYKILFKREGFVFNAWYSQSCTTGWLREPQLHDIGLKFFDKAEIQQAIADNVWETIRFAYNEPLKLTLYPTFWYPFDLTEDEELLKCQGRVALDIHTQEALTSLLTSTVNAAKRASNFYPTSEGLPGEDAALAELGPLKHGVVMKGNKITTFQTAWPNNILLAVTQVLDQRNANQTGNTDFAAIARKDANKTATEMELATEQHQSLNATELDIFSSPFLDTYALCYQIATHQAIFLLCKPPPDFNTLFANYNFAPAGDIEVVQRLETRNSAKEFFNIVKGTPLAEKLFAFLLQQFFPEQAPEWIKVLNSPDKDAIIKQLLSILKTIPIDELTPEQRTALTAIIITTENVVGAGANQTVPPSSNQTQGQSALPSDAVPQGTGA